MRLHRFAVLTAVVTYVLLIVGGLVHGTGSSLACPDWPLCHGSMMPRMEKGVEFEHTHRLVAGLVAILTVILGAWIWKDRRQRALRPLGLAAPVMVLVQALLGGLTVLYRLPKPITLSHLTLSMCFFSVVIVIAIRSRVAPHIPEQVASEQGQAPASPPRVPRADLARVAGSRSLVAASVLAVLGQIFLGGLVRHSMAGLACITFPFCFGQVWPRESESEQYHMLHRFGAVVVAILVVSAAVLVLRRTRGVPGMGSLRATAFAAPFLVLVQGTLGVLSVTSLLHLPTVTAHLAVGALLLACQVTSWTLLGAPLLMGTPRNPTLLVRASGSKHARPTGSPREDDAADDAALGAGAA
jgi:heme A synthase